MLTFRVTDDVKAMADAIGNIGQRHIPFATVVALTRTAVQAKQDLRTAMEQQLDRPTNWTLNSLYTKPATMADPVATVWIKDKAAGIPAAKYLTPQIDGGKRSHKRFERALQLSGILPAGWYVMPGSAAPIDAYGNIAGRYYSSVLAQLQASGTPEKNKPKGSSMRVRGRQAQLFAMSKPHGRLKPGIYQRFKFAHGSAVKPLFIFTRKPPHYARRYRFWETIEQTAKQQFPVQFARAFDEALQRFGA